MLAYQFTHALVRETVEEAVSPLQRARLHIRIAEALEQVHEADDRPALAELAGTTAPAPPSGRRPRPSCTAAAPATQARRSAAYDEAGRHLSSALPHTVAASPERVELLLELGDVQLSAAVATASRSSAAATAFEHALRIGAHDLAADAAIGYEMAVHIPGLPGDRAVQLVRRALELC